MAYPCHNCRHNRQLKVGEKLLNIRREGNTAICNDCGRIIAAFDNDAR